MLRPLSQPRRESCQEQVSAPAERRAAPRSAPLRPALRPLHRQPRLPQTGAVVPSVASVLPHRGSLCLCPRPASPARKATVCARLLRARGRGRRSRRTAFLLCPRPVSPARRSTVCARLLRARGRGQGRRSRRAALLLCPRPALPARRGTVCARLRRARGRGRHRQRATCQQRASVRPQGLPCLLLHARRAGKVGGPTTPTCAPAAQSLPGRAQSLPGCPRLSAQARVAPITRVGVLESLRQGACLPCPLKGGRSPPQPPCHAGTASPGDFPGPALRQRSLSQWALYRQPAVSASGVALVEATLATVLPLPHQQAAA